MERFIVYIVPENKKIQLTQFHTEAENMFDAIENIKKFSSEKFKVLGVRNYPEVFADKWFNNKFY
jgi:hypothetical protein